MRKDRAVSVWNPAFRDDLSDLVRAGAQRLIRRAVEAELKTFLDDTSVSGTGRGGERWYATATNLSGGY